VLAGGVVVLVVFLKRRNRVGGSQDAVLLKKKPGPPEFLPIAFGPSMIESKLSKKDKDLVPALERLKDVCSAANHVTRKHLANVFFCSTALARREYGSRYGHYGQRRDQGR
jgi:hypothetical protein